MLQDTTHINGIMFALEFFNHLDTDILIKYLNAFDLVGERGNAYSTANLGAGQFDAVWEKHGGKANDLDLKMIEAGSSMKYAIAFTIPDRVKPAKLRFGRYNINIQFNHESRKRIPELPPKLKQVS